MKMIRLSLFIVATLIFCLTYNGWAEVRQNPDKLYNAGVIAFVKHDLNKASRLLEEAIKIGLPDPQLKDARNMLRLIKFDNVDAVIVGKYKINTKEFIDIFKRNCFVYKNNKENILNSMINEKIMLIAAEDIGLRVTDIEIDHVLTRNPAFMKDNKFNREIYLRTLKLNRLTPEKYEDSITVDLTLKKLQSNLKKDINVFIEDYKKKITVTINKELVEDLSCVQ